MTISLSQLLYEAAVADFKQPTKTIVGYKLFGTKKTQPGKIYPLFICKQNATPMKKWIPAQFCPTKGFAKRPGWHLGTEPNAAHLLRKDGTLDPKRVWAEVLVPADIDWNKILKDRKVKELVGEPPLGGYYNFKRPRNQGGMWIIAGAIYVNRLLSPEEVLTINNKG